MVVKRVFGFMQIAKEIIIATPGLTAQEIYIKASDVARKQGRHLSAAKDPQGSLVATLHKHHPHYGLERRKIGREFRYYPVGSKEIVPLGASANGNPAGGCLQLPDELEQRIDALVSLGRFRDKEEAQRELIGIGLATLMSKLAS